MKTGMKAQEMRLTNTSLVLKTILSSPTPISRTKVATQTSLTRATVSRLVDSLIDAGLIEELEPERTSPGRPSLPLQAPHKTCLAIGLDISASAITAYLMDLAGNEIQALSRPGNYRNSDPDVVMAELSLLVAELDVPADAIVAGMSLSVPGIYTGTTVLTAPNLGWKNVDLAPLLDAPESYGDLELLNEADASGYSVLYSRPGFTREDTTFVYVSGQVGIGASLFLDGKIFGGRHSWAGELGHVCVDPDGPECRCGSNGCLEQYLGQDALLVDAGITGDFSELVNQARTGNERVISVLNAAGASLGRAIATVVNLLDLDTIVLGGHLATLYGYLEETMRNELKYRVLGSRWSSIVIDPEPGDEFTAARGACLVAFEHLINSPESIVD